MELEYWKEFYKSFMRVSHSDFAEYIHEHYLKKGDSILDIGCGDGLDSFYFMLMGLNVTAIDQAIPQTLIDRYSTNIIIVKSDAIRFLEESKGITYNHIFARFFLHAISDSEEEMLLPLIYERLSHNGYLHIETRTMSNIKDTASGCDNSHTIVQNDGHLRRFISPELIKLKLEFYKFKIIEIKEDSGFSSFNPKDILMRIICKKL